MEQVPINGAAAEDQVNARLISRCATLRDHVRKTHLGLDLKVLALLDGLAYVPLLEIVNYLQMRVILIEILSVFCKVRTFIVKYFFISAF